MDAHQLQLSSRCHQVQPQMMQQQQQRQLLLTVQHLMAFLAVVGLQLLRALRPSSSSVVGAAGAACLLAALH